MSQNNIRPSVCSPPLPTPENFPSLTKDPSTLQQPFKRYLVIKHQDPNVKMSDPNPFEIDRKIKTVIGKKSGCKIKL